MPQAPEHIRDSTCEVWLWGDLSPSHSHQWGPVTVSHIWSRDYCAPSRSWTSTALCHPCVSLLGLSSAPRWDVRQELWGWSGRWEGLQCGLETNTENECMNGSDCVSLKAEGKEELQSGSEGWQIQCGDGVSLSRRRMGDADHSSAALLSRSLPGFGDKAADEWRKMTEGSSPVRYLSQRGGERPSNWVKERATQHRPARPGLVVFGLVHSLTGWSSPASSWIKLAWLCGSCQKCLPLPLCPLTG